jgi:hypothetical protein
VESRVSAHSLRIFVGALGGEAVEINEANVPDLSQLCDEIKFIKFAKMVGNWQVEHPQIDSVTRCELDLVRVELEEPRESQARTILMLEAEVSGLRSLLGGTAASVEKAARDIDQAKGLRQSSGWLMTGRFVPLKRKCGEWGRLWRR